MKCRICGRDCPPGAKICRDCAAARKRAFAQTVTQPLLAAVGAPSVAEPRFAPRPARRRAANDPAVERAAAPRVEAPALPLTAVPRKSGALWLLVCVLAVAAIGFVWLRARNGGLASDQPARIEAPPPPAAAVQPASPPSIEESESERPTVQAPPIKVRVSHAAKKAVPHPEPAAPVFAAPAPAPEPAPVVRAAPAPPRATEPTRDDPWQAMNEGLARCGREAFYDRIDCEQRLRMRYCANSWGLVPQCPIGPVSQELR
jgi:hypothetical protein